jgi:malonyl-CoA O-methyltransferase
MIFFATPGPLTLRELSTVRQNNPTDPLLQEFVDMHDIGDMMLNTGFSDPVMDSEILTVHYHTVQQLLDDLKSTTPYLFHAKSRESLGSANAPYCATFEILYGHAWRHETGLHACDKEGIVRIPADKIPILVGISEHKKPR